MRQTPVSSQLERNIRLYPRYAALFNSFFWLPVFFLYFSESLSLEQVLLLEAIYYFAVVLLEVPSGYFSDVIGRRPTLLISSLALTVAYGVFLIGGSFAMFATAQVFLAIGISFNSGTDVSFHYDSLANLKRENEFADREARVARNAFLASAVAALLGGAVAAFTLRMAYLLSLVAAIASVCVVLLFREPVHRQRRTVTGLSFLRQVGSCLGYLRQADLRWLFGFVVLMTILNHVPYEFYQPYIDLLDRDLPISGSATPIATGLHTAAAMLIGAWAASRSVRLRNRIGLAATLLLCAVLQIVIIGMMGLTLQLAVVPLIMLRCTPRALMAAPLNAAIAPRLPSSQRATYLSLQSLVGRLAFAGTLAGLACFARSGAAVDWATLSAMTRMAAGLGLVGLVILAATVVSLRRSSRQQDNG